MPQIHVEMLPLDEVARWPRNPKLHADGEIQNSVERFGFVQPLLLDEQTGRLVAGHGRLEALQAMRAAGKPTPKNIIAKGDKWLVPVLRGVSFKSEAEAEAFLLADNRLVEMGGWDPKGLSEILSNFADKGVDLSGIGFSPDDLTDLLVGLQTQDGNPNNANNALATRFLVPPFSVLDARQGYWQERKRQWISLGIRSELGRGDNLLKFSDTVRLPLKRLSAKGARYSPNEHLPEEKQRALGVYSAAGGTIDRASGTIGTSIFDPVLCELAYRWWCLKGGTVLDPFAGGSVRGVVAAWLGYSYVGYDLSKEQIAANALQWKGLAPKAPLKGCKPEWRLGDSRGIEKLAKGVQADFVFSCPPYADLEVYSDDPADLSNMPYDEFLDGYRKAIAGACSRLKPNRFACFVVGDVRDDKGFYRSFPEETVRAFEAAGCVKYNEAILVTSVGSLPLRIAKPFARYRKLGKTHQNVLVFFKGDPRKIPEALGEVEAGSFELPEVEPESDEG